MKVHNIQVEIRGELRTGGYRLKVSVLDLGMYIDGFRALPSKKFEGTWYITPPSTEIAPRQWKNIVEFAKSKPLWTEIVTACEETIDIYSTSEKVNGDVSF